jgi:hypothetical protein
MSGWAIFGRCAAVLITLSVISAAAQLSLRHVSPDMSIGQWFVAGSIFGVLFVAPAVRWAWP